VPLSQNFLCLRSHRPQPCSLARIHVPLQVRQVHEMFWT
jgi:hypothetical protein